MNELLLRIETLCWEVNTPLLLGVGAGAALVGLILWLGGVRYSTVVIGLLGAAVGTVVGMFVGQQFGLDLLLSIAGGALVLGVVSILLRNILIIVLATAIFALVAAGGYTSLVLDGTPDEQQADPNVPLFGRALEPQAPSMAQAFSGMDPNSRDIYLGHITASRAGSEEGSEVGFEARAKAVLGDTWDLLSPYKWQLLGVIVVGGIGGFLLVWFVKTVVLPLCYSIVGAAGILLGAQLLLLGVGFRAASALPPQRWVMPTIFGTMSVMGWVAQLWTARKPRSKTSGTERGGDDD